MDFVAKLIYKIKYSSVKFLMTHCTDRIIANKFMYPWKFRSVLFFSPPNSGKKILDSCLSLTLAHFYDTLQMYAYTKSVLNRFSFSLFFPFFLQPIVYTPSNYNPPHYEGKISWSMPFPILVHCQNNFI